MASHLFSVSCLLIHFLMYIRSGKKKGCFGQRSEKNQEGPSVGFVLFLFKNWQKNTFFSFFLNFQNIFFRILKNKFFGQGCFAMQGQVTRNKHLFVRLYLIIPYRYCRHDPMVNLSEVLDKEYFPFLFSKHSLITNKFL